MYKIVNGEEVLMSDEEVEELQSEWSVNELLNEKYNNNRIILEKLKELDLKSIRAIRTNDTVRMAELEQEAAILRLKLL